MSGLRWNHSPWAPLKRKYLTSLMQLDPGSPDGPIHQMCPGTSGCPIRVVGYAMSVILSSQYSTAGITVESVVEFSVQNALPILFLCHWMGQVLVVKIGKGLGFVTFALINGSRRQQLLIMALLQPPLVSALHHLQQAWSALSLVAPVIVAALLVQFLTQPGLINVYHIVHISLPK